MENIQSNAEKSSIQSSREQPSTSATVDEALVYLRSHHNYAITDELALKRIRRKVDWRIFPLLSSVLLVQNLDKFSLNYAAVMGLRQDLQLKGNDFTNIATAFFVAFIVAEMPNVYLLQRIAPAKWLGLNVALWGIATASSAGATNFSTLLTARIFLGIFEATSIPSSGTIAAQWYTKAEAAPRYAYWFLGNGLALLLGGLISFGFQHIEGGVLSGWRTMFLVLGVLTVGVGIAVAWLVPSTPMQASFLSNEEKVILLRHISVNEIGVRNPEFRSEQIWEGLRDPQIWIFCVAFICLAEPSGIISVYSSTLIHSMGFSPKSAALLNMPSGLVAILSTLSAGYAIRVTPGHHRWLWISLCALLAAVGAALMSFLPPSNKPGILIGIWLVNAITATFPMAFHYMSVNVSGHTKRSFASNILPVCFGIGSIIGPQSFQARDAPEYAPAKIAALVTVATVALLMCVLALYYVWENRRRNIRDADTGEGERGGSTEERLGGRRETSDEVWAGLTDRKNKRWRYVY